MTATFQAGSRYQLTFIGNADLHVTYEVVKRTAKFVTLTDGTETVRCKVMEYEGEEQCMPEGSYSMCPVLGARRKVSGPIGTLSTGCGT
jgi:hypothetical protein